jgi:xylan 1,4-beta-xylosidase
VAEVRSASLVLVGEGRTLSHARPTFVGRRQRRHDARISTVVVDHSTGVGGLAVRYDEHHHYSIEIDAGWAIARAALPTLAQEHRVELARGPVELVMEMRPVDARFPAGGDDPAAVSRRMSCDAVHLAVIDAAGHRHDLAVFDGRYLTAESACSFTGRVAGVYCVTGELAFAHYSERRLDP